MAKLTDHQLNTDVSASFSPEAILSYLEDNGTINMGNVEQEMKRKRRTQILESNHPYTIYQGTDGRWRTYVRDPSKKTQRRLIVKTYREDLEDYLFMYYESPDYEQNKVAHTPDTMASLKEEWLAYKSLHVSAPTIERVRRDWERYYKDSEIVQMPLTALTKLNIDIWVHKTIQKFNMDKHQYTNFRLIIRQELDYAVDKGIIDSNPFLRVIVDTKRVLRREHKKADLTQVSQTIYKNTERLLDLYRKVQFRVKQNLSEIDTELYIEDRKRLADLLHEIIDFDMTAEKKRIQDQLVSNELNLCLLEMMEDALLVMREYPDNGEEYYRLLRYRYFEPGKVTNEDVMMMLDDMPPTTFYRKRRKAIQLYAAMLWTFTGPQWQKKLSAETGLVPA